MGVDFPLSSARCLWVTLHVVFFMPYVLCSMPFALCTLHYVLFLYPLLSALCSMFCYAHPIGT